jgi:hypothetical protein
MSGLQTIVNYCNGIDVNRRKTVGIQYTRNEIPRVSQTPTRNPWHLTLDMPNRFRYSQARALMEQLDTLDRITPQIVTFSNLAAQSWIFKYQGAYTTGQITSGVTVTSFVGDQLTLNVTGLPAGAGTVLFGEGIIVGNNCQFNMFCPNMPTYKLTVGGYIGNGTTTTNNALLEFSDSFELYEFVGTA